MNGIFLYFCCIFSLSIAFDPTRFQTYSYEAFLYILKNSVNVSSVKYSKLLNGNTFININNEILHKNSNSCSSKIKNEIVSIYNNGTISYKYPKKENLLCYYKCMYGNKVHNLIKSKYQIINNVPLSCETFVLKCKNGNTISLVDVFLKFKTIPQMETTLKNENKKYNYDVHTLVLEGLSKKTMLQHFKKTIKFLKSRNNVFMMDKYISVSNTTTGNVYAMFFNKNLNDIKSLNKKSSFQKADVDLYDCKKSFSNMGFIGDIFQKNNYITLLAENGYNSIFKNPNCNGQIQPIFNYTSFPYGKIMSFLVNSDDEYNSIYTGQCKASFYDLLTYSQDFYRQKSENPKFSINWYSGFTNKSISAFERADLALTEFFITNSDILDKSFFFLLTDKGEILNDDEEKSYKTVDDVMPFMLISIPKNFDETSKLYQNVKTNSEETKISSFDIYATLYDILEQSDFRKAEKDNDIKNNFFKGKSIFKPIDKRSCLNMNVDYQFCIDSYTFTTLKYIPEEVLQTFQYIFIKSLNNKLKESKLDVQCHKLTLKPNYLFKISYVLNDNQNIFWKITGTVEPGDGIFTAIFDDELNLFDDDIKRHNPNGNQSFPCVSNSRYAIYCQFNDVTIYATFQHISSRRNPVNLFYIICI